MRLDGRFYLNQENDEKVKVGDSSELLKHVLGDEVPERVLQTEGSQSKRPAFRTSAPKN